jgi:3-oxoacyl-[acyl-carrier protein] reductase
MTILMERKSMLLNGKTVLITGATRGIGKATAEIFVQNGAKVILQGRDEDRLNELKTSLEAVNNVKIYSVCYDVREYNEIKNAFLWIKKNIGRLDVLINNAGVMDDALIGMVNQTHVENTFSVNLNAVLFHMQYASRIMTKQKQGSIINVSSIIGRTGNEGQTVYGASKAGVIGATLSASKELGVNGIRVNAVAPGFIDTDLTNQLSPQKYEERLQNIKMKRAGQPEEVANVMLFLASDLSSYVTGQVIGVDGGMVI